MITRLGLQNFKSFKDVEINLSNLNLFTGLNGMGKSSFLQSLLLLRQSEPNFTQEFKGLVLKGDIIDLGKGKDIYNFNAENDYIKFEIDFDYDNYLNLIYDYEAESDILSLNIDCEQQFEFNRNASLFNNRFTYLKPDRIVPEHNYKANLAAVKKDRFLGYRGENTPLYIALHKQEEVPLKGLRHKHAKAPNLISNIDAWLNEIIPGIHVLSTYFNELDIVKMGFQFDTDSEYTPEFSAPNVGVGITYLLPVITALLRAKKDDLIIIDTPEAHLHPKGQAKMGELFAIAANVGVQIIVESHSDHILNGMRVAVKNGLIGVDDVSVFYFEREVNLSEHYTNILQPVIDKNGRIDQWPKGFFDEYSNQLNQLI